jgi:hypothetical protein
MHELSIRMKRHEDTARAMVTDVNSAHRKRRAEQSGSSTTAAMQSIWFPTFFVNKNESESKSSNTSSQVHNG